MLIRPQRTSQRQATLPSKSCCKFTYRARCFKNKGALLLLVWNSLTMALFQFLSVHIYIIPNAQYLLSIVIMPIAGWLADVYCGRYKVIYCGMWIMWIASVLATLSSVVEQLVSSYDNSETSKIVAILLVVFQVIGLASFQTNILQFGLDQLYDASTDEIISFIQWFCWTYCLGYILNDIAWRVMSCLVKGSETLLLCEICICLTIALTSSFLFNHILIKEPVKQMNPYKQVYKVIKYAIKNKRPRCRSAFTYCEDKLPSRIDFSKSKYGGPFTTEQVEDVKTFLRLMVIIFFGSIVMSEIIPIHWVTDRMILTINGDNSDINLRLAINCFTKAIPYDMSPIICTIAVIPLYEFLLYPFLHNYLSRVTSRCKILLGMVLQLARVVSLMLIELKARDAYLSQRGHNATIQCLFVESYGELSSSFDSRWMTVPIFFNWTSILLLIIGCLEFICAQSPQLMKGVLFGFTYGSVLASVAIGYGIYVPFTKNLSTWGTGKISCGFWYLLMTLLLMIVKTLITFTAIKLYKNRKREDVLPNEHIFAERYYSN